MTTTPKPGPVIPLPAVRGAGVNQDSVEMRSRLMQLILSNGIKDVDSILTLMDRMELGPDFDEEDDDEGDAS